MRYLYQLMCAVVVLGLAAASASAQGGGGQGGGGQGGGGLGGGGQGGGAQGGGGMGGGAQGGGAQGGGGGGGTALTQLEAAPSITAPGTTGGGASSAVSASNVLGGTLANPLYQGTPTNAKSNAAPGGFGAVLYPTAAGNAAGGRAGGARGGIGGATSTANQFGTIISLPVQVSYPAVARFPAAPMSATKLQADLSGMIGRSTMIANPAGVQVLANGDTVTLRGTAKDADEARMIAGMVRMTPGVRGVVNEITFPQQ